MWEYETWLIIFVVLLQLAIVPPWQWTVPCVGIKTGTLLLLLSGGRRRKRRRRRRPRRRIWIVENFLVSGNFVKISITVWSIRKSEYVESVSAGKQHAHSETRRESFSLQKIRRKKWKLWQRLFAPVAAFCYIEWSWFDPGAYNCFRRTPEPFQRLFKKKHLPEDFDKFAWTRVPFTAKIPFQFASAKEANLNKLPCDKILKTKLGSKKGTVF